MKNWLKQESAIWWPLFLIPVILIANIFLINKNSVFNDENLIILGGPQENNQERQSNDSVIAKSALAQEISEKSEYSEISILKSFESTSWQTDSDALIQKTSVEYKKPKKNGSSYFSPPASGWNWGIIHENNAVDIANNCGTPVYASAEGIIIPDPKLEDDNEGWNNGYGFFVLIKHPNNAETRYAHLEKIFADIGRYVSKGELIGFIGNTGNTHGPTGCHLHFEVLGAENPLAK